MFSRLAWISSSHGVLILQRMAKKLAFESSRHSGGERRRTAVFAGYVRTLLNLGCVYTSAVSNRHGYILSKPYQKVYHFEESSKPSHEYDLFVFLAVTSWPRHVLWPEILRRLYLEASPFTLCHIRNKMCQQLRLHCRRGEVSFDNNERIQSR